MYSRASTGANERSEVQLKNEYFVNQLKNLLF